MVCEYGYGLCKEPDGGCPHWQGIFCELDMPKVVDDFDKYIKEHPEVVEKVFDKVYENLVDWREVSLEDRKTFHYE